MDDHFNLLFAAGFAEAIQEAQRRLGSVSVKSRGTLSELSYQESLRVLTEAIGRAIASGNFLSADLCKANGLSFSEAVFLKVILTRYIAFN